MQVRKLSGTSVMGYSREGLENRLNTAYFDLDKKIEMTLDGCTFADGARREFQEVCNSDNARLDESMDSCQDHAICLLFLFLFLSVYLYHSSSPTSSYVLLLIVTGGEAGWNMLVPIAAVSCHRSNDVYRSLYPPSILIYNTGMSCTSQLPLRRLQRRHCACF